MILGIGIDSAEIERFARWQKVYTPERLLRIFSPLEIDYCLQVPIKSAERFAVRFALKEAFLKALSIWQPNTSFSFLSLARHIQLYKEPNQTIGSSIAWNEIALRYPSCKMVPVHHISATHTKTHATAVIILEKP
jgi:holo-[acyl-carrier protein] synthase